MNRPPLNRPSILILHGALGSGDQLAPLAEAFEDFADVHILNLPGHGGRTLPEDFSIPAFAEYVQDYITQNKLQQPTIFGYSMGGYIACYLEAQRPETFSCIITLATKYEWDQIIAQREIKMLQPDIIEQKVPQLAAALQQRHAPEDWKAVLERTQAVLKSLGDQPLLNQEVLVSIKTPVLVLLGDRDKMVGMDETIAAYRQLPNAALGILPATGHPVEQAPLDLLAKLVKDFILGISA